MLGEQGGGGAWVGKGEERVAGGCGGKCIQFLPVIVFTTRKSLTSLW